MCTVVWKFIFYCGGGYSQVNYCFFFCCWFWKFVKISKKQFSKLIKKINYIKLIIGLTIFRRWRTVHGAEENPSPNSFGMVLQKAPSNPNIITSSNANLNKNNNLRPVSLDSSSLTKVVSDFFCFLLLFANNKSNYSSFETIIQPFENWNT